MKTKNIQAVTSKATSHTRILTDAKRKKQNRNEKIRHDFKMLHAIHGNTAWGVITHLAKRYKVSTSTINRCVKDLYRVSER